MKNNILSILRKNLILRKAVILSLTAFLMINLATAANAETLEEALAHQGET